MPINSHAERNASELVLPIGSANGVLLKVTTLSGGTHIVHAVWAAPSFVILTNTDYADQKPLLYHAKSLADARRFQCLGGGIILNADFTEWKPEAER